MPSSVSQEQNDFFSITTREELASFFHISKRHLAMLSYKPMKRYTKFKVLKKNGKGFREISAPRSDLKQVQRSIADALSAYYQPPACVYGYVPNKSIADNAARHVRKRCILSIDIKDFFPSITGSRIHGLLRKRFNFSEEVADTLTNLVCDNGCLPQGAPSSPVLSNIICYSMDRAFLNLASRNQITYTRYADDLVFSSTSSFKMKAVYDRGSSGKEAVSAAVKGILEQNGFLLNEDKIHFAHRGTRLSVNGIVVNKKCNFKRTEYRALRVLFHNWKVSGLEVAANKYALSFPTRRARFFDEEQLIPAKFVAHIRGRLEYYTMITSPNGCPPNPLIKLWTLYHERTGEQTPYLTKENTALRVESCYGANEDLFAADGSAFICFNKLITCRHCLTSETNSASTDSFSEHDIAIYDSFGNEMDFKFKQFVLRWDYDLAFIDNIKEIGKLPKALADCTYLPQPGETVTGVGYAAGNSIAHSVIGKVTDNGLTTGLGKIDQPFIHGMSGGPVFNSKHKVIGIIVEGSPSDSFTKNGAYIPMRLIKDLFNL